MRSPVINILLSFLLLGSGSLLFIAKKDNGKLDRDLGATRLKVDSLSKEKESLDNDVKKIKRRSDSLSSKSEELEKSLAQTNSRIVSKEWELRKTQKSAEESNKKYNELLAAKKECDKQLASLKAASDKLAMENKTVENKLALLNDDNKKLNDQLLIARAAVKDNILIETFTKSGSLNLKGRKVRKIVASLTTLNEMKNPSFRIFDPNGIQLPDQYGSFNLKSSSETSSGSGSSLKLELTYSLSKKIGSGVYKIEMSNENKHIENFLVRFR